MGIKNAGNIAVLLSAQEKLKSKDKLPSAEQNKKKRLSAEAKKATNNLRTEKW